MKKIIGKSVVRCDGYEKISGKAQYGDDLHFRSMLYAACRYTDVPAALIKSIDVSACKKSPGFVDLAMCADVPGATRIGAIRQDHYPLVDKRIVYGGDVIAVVCASTYEQAVAAADLINVEYDILDGIFDPREAIKLDAPLIHPEFKSNKVVHYPLRKGDVEAGFKKSDHVISRQYETGFHEHAYIEPETVTVCPDSVSGGYTVYGSIQNPHTTRKVVAMYLGLKLNKVNAIGSTLGGSFGGKDDIINAMACRAALLCARTGCPIRLTNTRENSLKESYKRHPYYMDYQVGFNHDGRLVAMKINIIADSGAYSSQSFFVTWRSVVQATGPYEIENVATDITAVYTNNTYTAAYRGFGSPQVIFAQESLMDEIAEICGLNPLEVRTKNAFKQDSVTASGQKLNSHTVSLGEIVATATQKSDFLNKFKQKNKEDARWLHGIGMACSYRGCSLGAEGTDAASAVVSVLADGSIYLGSGLNENGQGLRTTFCQIVAQMLGVDMEMIVYPSVQTATTLDGGPTVASRGTLMGGKAVHNACVEIQKIFAQSLSISDISFRDNSIYDGDKLVMGWAAAAEKIYWQGVNLSAYGWAVAPDVSWDEETGQGNAYFTYVYGCHIAEVKIDKITGRIVVKKITAVHDPGRVINPLGAEGQVYGGVAQGIGYGILEDYNLEQGVLKSENFDNYLIPTAQDILDIDAVFVEHPDPWGPFGAKSLGEPTLELSAAAINNAYANAVGKRNYVIPLTLERVKIGINLRKPCRGSKVAITHQKQAYHLPNLDVTSPTSINEACLLLAKDKYTILAGGTDVLIELRHTSEHHKILDTSKLEELKKINAAKGVIGAGVTMTEIINHPVLANTYPLLIKAISQLGSVQIRNRATLGGNIANAALCADSVPALLCYDAQVKLVSTDSTRTMDLADFITGSYQTARQAGEIITEIILSPPANNCRFYQEKVGRRAAVNISRLSLAIMLSEKAGKIDKIAIAAGSLLGKVCRLSQLENCLIGKTLSSAGINFATQELAQLLKNEIGGRWSGAYKIPVFCELFSHAMHTLTGG